MRIPAAILLILALASSAFAFESNNPGIAAGVTGGNCAAGSFVTGINSSGLPTCATPAGTLPGGSPPQIIGFSSLNVAENQTVSGDLTFNRTGANALHATVLTINGITPGGACAANTFVTSVSSSGVPTCSAVTTIASPTFTGTLTFPDGSTYSAAGHNNMAALGVGQAAPTTPAIALTYNSNTTTGVNVNNNSAGASAHSIYYLNNGTSYGSIELEGTGFTLGGTFGPPDSLVVNTTATNGMWFNAGSASVASAPIRFTVHGNQTETVSSAGVNIGWPPQTNQTDQLSLPHSSMNTGPGITGTAPNSWVGSNWTIGAHATTTGIIDDANQVIHTAVGQYELGWFMFTHETVGGVMPNGTRDQYLALRTAQAGSGAGLVLETGTMSAPALSAGTGGISSGGNVNIASGMNYQYNGAAVQSVVGAANALALSGSGGGPTVTYTVNREDYLYFTNATGNWVTFTWEVAWSALSGGSGVTNLGFLPCSAYNGPGAQVQSVSISDFSGVNQGGGYTTLAGRMNPGQSWFSLVVAAPSGSPATAFANAATFAGSGNIYFGGTIRCN